jgi:hypothetical protein
VTDSRDGIRRTCPSEVIPPVLPNVDEITNPSPVPIPNPNPNPIIYHEVDPSLS